MIVRFVFANPTEWWKQPGAALLRWADKVPAEHFAIQVESIVSNNYHESVFPKSRTLVGKKWEKKWIAYKKYEFEVPDHLQWQVMEWLLQQNNVWYSIPQLFLIALCFIKPINDRLNWAILNHNRLLICTELGSRFIEKFMTIPIKESHDKIGLKDMFDLSETAAGINSKRLWK